MNVFVKMMMRTLLGVLFCMVFSLPLQVSAAPSEEDMQFLKDVYQAENQQNGGAVQQRLTVLSPYAKAAGNVSFYGDWKPALLLKGEAAGYYITLAGVEKRGQVPFYLEQTEDHMTIYYQLTKNWEKITIPAKLADVNALMKEQAQEIPALIKDVQNVSEDETQRTMLLTLDGNQLAELIRQAQAVQQKALPANATPEQKKMREQQDKFMELVMTSLGDLEYSITVDKSTKLVTTASMDLTQPAHRIAHAFLASDLMTLKPEQKEVCQCLVDSCQLKLDVTCVNPKTGNPEKVTIPEEVKQAKEVSMSPDKTGSKNSK